MAKLPKPSKAILGTNIRIALITSQFNAKITDAMREDAHRQARLLDAQITVDVRAPGVYDIGFLADAILAREDVDALVALGAVVTGETKHDEIVTHNAARVLADLAVRHAKPVGLGITGPGQSQAQARARIDRAGFAVESVVKQIRTLQGLSAPRARAH